MATWVSHTANLSGGQLQVWHYNTECEKLSLLAGRLGPASPKAEECKYYSHKKTQGDGEDTCPYHENCTRASLELYRDRSDFVYDKLGWPNILPFRYRSALCSPSHLYTLSRVFARDTATVMKSVVMQESTGLNACSFSQVNIKIHGWLTICFYFGFIAGDRVPSWYWTTTCPRHCLPPSTGKYIWPAYPASNR